MTGFVALQREAFDHPLLQDGERFRAWFWLVANAAWKPTRFDIRGSTATIERGQLCVSRAQLATAWGWSPSAVERFLTRLETEQMIGRATGQGRTIITISNYSKYQDGDREAGQPSEQATGQPADSQRTTKEQGNKGTIEEEPSGSSSPTRDECDEVFDAWRGVAAKLGMKVPRKLSPKRRAACRARLRDEGREAIIQAIEHVPRSAFLRGDRGDWDGANIDFLLRPDSVTKILEGRYDDRPSNPARPAPRDNRDGFTRALDERLGLGDTARPAGEADRRADGDGGGDRELAPARLAANR